jgi:hypothetical protein
MPGGLAYGERSLALVDDHADKGRRVSALVTHANLPYSAGQHPKARQFFEGAFAEAYCSRSTQNYAREERTRVFPPASKP